MPKGLRTSTTWKKGENPIKKKGMKSRHTVLKESLGLKDWNALVNYVNKEGAEKMLSQLRDLEGNDFTRAYNAIAEYIKPKLSRIDYRDETPTKNLFDLSSLPFELRKQILEHYRTNTNS